MAVQSITEKVRFIEGLFGRGNLARNSKNIEVRCPICAPSSADKKKLAIRITDDANHCWTCGWRARSLAPLIRRFFSTSTLLTYKDKFRPDLFIDTTELVEQRHVVELPSDFRFIATAPDHDPDVRDVRSYLLNKRRLSNDDLWYYKIGVSNERRFHRRAIIPSYDETGRLNYFITRAIDPNCKRYDNPDCDHDSVVFNAQNINWEMPITLCEGVFDMMKCGENCIPLLGSDLSLESLLCNEILLRATRVYLALDGDMWDTKTPKIAKMLESFNVDVWLVDTRRYGDPGSTSKSIVKESIDSASKLDWNSTFMSKLNRATSVTLGIKKHAFQHVR